MASELAADAAKARAAWAQLAERTAVVSAAGLQQRWGLSQQRVSQLTALDGFPPPLSRGRGALWLAVDVDQWRGHREREGAAAAADDSAKARLAWETVARCGGLLRTCELAERWSITADAARERTKLEGFPPPAAAGRWLAVEVEAWEHGRPEARWTAHADQSLIGGYRGGSTLEQIAGALGCSVGSVVDRVEALRSTGVDLPQRKPRWTKARRTRLAELRRQGRSLRQLEAEFEISRGTLTSQLRTLRRLGYDLGEPPSIHAPGADRPGFLAREPCAGGGAPRSDVAGCAASFADGRAEGDGH